ncbi:hypothetical protein HN873_066346 [Arachis hypogaea]
MFFPSMRLLFFYVFFVGLKPSLATNILGNETDVIALLRFKESISNDPYGVLSSWNASSHFCNWHGITCSIKHQRVQQLSLQQCRLFRLQQLYLPDNKLTGEFPVSLANCSELRLLNMSSNNLYGQIPMEIGTLKKLEKLSLNKNNYSGEIPSSIWNISSLSILSMGYNYLEGKIPEEIGKLKSLSGFAIGANKLSGELPSSLYNLSLLALFYAAENQFHGSLPSNMFSNLISLQEIGIGGNQISGPIPTSISNASSLQLFDIGYCSFVGKVPNLGNLKDLYWLNLNYNNLGSNSALDLDFITSLINCTELESLVLCSNNFGGVLPNSIGNLSTQLTEISLDFNHIHGTIPETICNNINLITLNLEYNHLTGFVPNSFGKFQKMQLLSLGANHLIGDIPFSLGNLTQLVEIRISNNMLHGKIPPSIGNWQNLLYLDFSGNNFSGAIPVEVFSLSSLSTNLNLSHNSLNGTLPVEVGALGNLGTLDISNNYLSGQIPMTIGKCTSMEYLNLHGNSFSGMIPSSVASLKGLSHLDLSQNNLSGSIPTDMQRLSFLTYLNVSFNMLEGKVPLEGVFKNATSISIVGNNKLCGGVLQLHLAPCPANVMARSNHHNLKLAIIIICVVVCLILLSIVVVVFLSKKKKRTSSLTASTNQYSMVSYQILHHSTEGFSTSNLIGSGSFGSVYKGFLESEHKFVAIKVINLRMSGAHKSFIAECNALKFIRHRNLVKILTCCSSIDYSSQEFKALVFEYMPNGSLEKWLHPSAEITDRLYTLDLTQRLNIVVDVASALHYLHYGCEQPIVHCDLKPENVLLDDDMVAHVTDFGLARLLSMTNGDPHNQSSTTVFKGTIGYAPPEYGMSCEVSMQGDVYSFGILVLEMVTGRRPMEEMFKDDNNLHNYVKMAYSNNLLEIMDSTLLPKQIGEEENYTKKLTMCVFSLIRIGLACSVESPNERMNMADVTRELNLTKDVFLQH